MRLLRRRDPPGRLRATQTGVETPAGAIDDQPAARRLGMDTLTTRGVPVGSGAASISGEHLQVRTPSEGGWTETPPVRRRGAAV